MVEPAKPLGTTNDAVIWPLVVALAVVSTVAPKLTSTGSEGVNPRQERVTRDPAGPVPGFYQRGWVTRDQISTFTASANRREVSGDLARHARLKGDPPRRTMTLGEARQLIGALVTRRLDWLRESSDS
jgi:hypothetical protein